MTHVKFNGQPFTNSLNNLVDDIFSEFPSIWKNEFNQTERKGFVPVNVKETDKAFELEVIAPGFQKPDFKISLDQNILTISAEQKNEVEEKEQKKFIKREYGYRSFKRSFTINEKVDATNISASYINGVLLLNLPKKEEVKPSVTEIEIK
ncbi:MAG TPA: Hsp20/alpha crystallin family protein [Chitinophagaceae bacterium]|nr:Hsp20/alpha crystallin family protein [Chitinophagaceae bacterium]